MSCALKRKRGLQKEGGIMIRLYRFYNFVVGKHGEPFAMCDECKKKYNVPSNCVMNVLADKARWSCKDCGKEPK